MVELHGLLREMQNGFRKDRCGADNNFVLHTILSKAATLSKKVFLSFVDISKAYDSVDRLLLWAQLEQLDVDAGFLRAVKSLYEKDCVSTRGNRETTRKIFLKKGLCQGCSLSPMLLALYVSELVNGLVLSKEGFKVGAITISSLFFAGKLNNRRDSGVWV